MATQVLLTIDTELTWGHYSRGVSWRENLALSYEPAGVGVAYQLERFREDGIKACFFVDPMPALPYGIEPIRRMVEPILAAEQEVQLHIHPVWVSVAEGNADGAHFELTLLDAEAQRELIAQAAELIVRAGAPQPIAFRSGSFAADERTLDALRSLGIRYDSSHNGSLHPDPSNLPLAPADIAPVSVGGITELPVTQIESAPGALRPLQLCAVSIKELREALLHAAANDHPAVTIVSHSFELASRDGLRPNRTVCDRFEALCAFLAENRETLPTAHFTDLDRLPLGRSASPLPARRLRTTARIMQQIWSNAVYERRL